MPAPDAVVTAPAGGSGKAESRNGYEYPPASTAAGAAAPTVPALPPTIPPQVTQTSRMQVTDDMKGNDIARSGTTATLAVAAVFLFMMDGL